MRRGRRTWSLQGGKARPFSRGKTRNRENVELKEKEGSNLTEQKRERERGGGGKDQIIDEKDRKTSWRGRKGGMYTGLRDGGCGEAGWSAEIRVRETPA